jgi:hypothetical protein
MEAYKMRFFTALFKIPVRLAVLVLGIICGDGCLVNAALREDSHEWAKGGDTHSSLHFDLLIVRSKEFLSMLSHYPILKDIAAILMVGGTGWLIILFLSRGLAWLASAAVSGLMLLILIIADLVQYASTAPAGQIDLLLATGLCLAVHLVSDGGLLIVNQRMARVQVCDDVHSEVSFFAEQTRSHSLGLLAKPAHSSGD